MIVIKNLPKIARLRAIAFGFVKVKNLRMEKGETFIESLGRSQSSNSNVVDLGRSSHLQSKLLK